MIRARGRFFWNMTSTVLAVLINPHRGNAAPVSPDELNPFVQARDPYPVLSARDSMELLRSLVHNTNTKRESNHEKEEE